MTEEMILYYARRAAEYERIYRMPEWQDDLRVLITLVEGLAAGRRVFEVACGTGYWTEQLARTAREVLAIDVNEDVLAIARSRSYGPARVELRRGDAYTAPPARPRTPGDGRRFDAALAALWLSHVDVTRMGEFLAAFHAGLEPGARVLMFDERAEGRRRLPASRTDAAGNRYEMRKLRDGERFEIVKNLYDERGLRALLAGWAEDLEYRALENFWAVDYRRP